MVSATQKDMKIVSSVDPVTNNVSSPENPYPQASVVTLAGENKGAIMHIGSSSKKESSIPIHRAYKTNQTEETTTDEDENSCEDSIDKTFVNSNIQSMNNSMLLHGSISGRDPGVRLILQPQHSIKYLDTGNSGKGQIVNKSSYRPQPVVRRRCLRGLLLESSDSEPDNTNKPSRHGCKVPCGVTN
ncbi:hypothetical protein TanjilG_09761 [Lupinus angustifolius]|uniref:Uncharacterized protein n=2 Tax=Lupinus angustifolius TaxID=3871 RepID=A0A4P1QWD8_LUPAN|nr:hypothetical protein TanjilG_09761 [Lupinus angustifolius]